MISFSPLSSAGPGGISHLLKESYAPLLLALSPDQATHLLNDWDSYDQAVVTEPDTIGAAGFLSWVGEELAGFSSWDPRGHPQLVEIGQNCVMPRFQGKGLGTRQIQVSLSKFAKEGFNKARVRTDEHPFFRPALRMYEKCGFVPISREPGGLLPGYRTILLERALRSLRGTLDG